MTMTRKEAQALLDGMTPGPWFQGRGADHPDWNGNNESEHCVWPDPVGVGRLIAKTGLHFTGWIEQDAANARAIASLPDILKALIAQIEDNERIEAERAEQWRLRREAEADRDTLKAANLTLREDNERLTDALAVGANALDRMLDRWVTGEAVTDDEGKATTEALFAMNRATHERSQSTLSPPTVGVPNADGSNWTRKTVAVWEEWRCGPYRAFKTTFDGGWNLADKQGVIFSATSLQEVMEEAATIKDRSDA